MTQAHSEFGGQEHFHAEPARLFDALTDLDMLAANVPDLVSTEKPDPRTLKCVIKPGFSFLRGTLKITISLTRLERPTAAAMIIAAQGIGAAMTIVSEMTISPEASGSLLDWRAKIERVSGLMATIPSALVKAAADQTIRQGWQRVRERLGEGSDS